jgi:hypothetical protein
MQRKMFDVLIPTVNRDKMLARCIDGLGGRYIDSIIVGYEKESDIAAVRGNPNIMFYQLGAKGCGDAKQKIYEKWKEDFNTPYFCIADDDCVVTPKICDRLYEDFSTDSKIAAMATVWGDFGINLQKLVYPIHDVNCSDTFCIYDRMAFAQTGGYDERMAVHEGFDVQARLRLMGWRVCIDKTCVMEHAYYSDEKEGTGAQTYGDKEDLCSHLLMRKYRDLLSIDETLSSSGRIRYTMNPDVLEKYRKMYAERKIVIDKYRGIVKV